MSPVVLDRRDNLDLGLWGTTWSVDQPGISPVILDIRERGTLLMVRSQFSLGHTAAQRYLDGTAEKLDCSGSNEGNRLLIE